MMAKEQPSIVDLLHLLESSDLHELDEIKEILNNNLSQDRGSLLLNSLVDYYLESSSAQALHILSSVREPHDKHLFDKMNECMAKPACRLATLTLLGHVIRKQPSWIHKISRSPVLPSLLKCLKTDVDAVVLITGVLVLITLLPMIPQAGKQHLYEFFDIFGRLAAWNMKNPGHVPEVYLIHLHASVYALFHRLYGMYPCNFVSYLRSHYSMKENVETFEEVVKPMLEHVRIHPELVTGTKDHELDPTRWKRFEIHDIVIECAKVSLDPKEASCEEGYSTMPEHFSTHVQHRQADPTASPYTDLQSSFGSSSSTPFSTPLLALSQLSGTQPPYRSPQTSRRLPEPSQELFWSPSSVCGMATPPSSRGISPTSTPSELSHSASHLPGRVQSTLAGGKGTPSCNTPATSSPPPLISDEFEHISLPPRAASPTRKNGKADSWKPGLTRQENIRDSEKGTSDEANNLGGESENLKTVTLNELPEFIKELELEQDQRRLEEREEDAFTEELYEITAAKRESPTLRGGFDSPFYRTTETLTGNQKKPVAHPAPTTASSCGQNTNSTPDKQAGQPVGGQEPCFFKPVFTPIEGPLQEPFRSHSPPAADEGTNQGKYSLFTPSPCKAQAAPYEPLFDLALPKAAALFVGRRTAEAVRRAGTERLTKEEEEEEEASTSPLEVLDRLIQQGGDMHVKELKRLPLPSKSADWTHFGGTAPVDELHTLRSQLLLLHTQLLYERYKREQHATRNRRLLRRIINATALEEQNAAMKDQLSLQEVDMQSLKDSLQDEQLRYQQQREEHEMMVSRLHSQTKQLQQGRDEYYAKSQELQSKLVECQKEMGMLRAELQKANKKVCNKGHLLNLLSQKLTSSETVQQQLEFLNKRLLLLGEVNELYAEELRHSNPDNTKEVEMMQASHKKELDKMKQSAVQQSQRLEAAQKRIAELESQLAKKEHLLLEPETQFRQLVAIYEVLKDEERRQRYNDILVNGLPDWRQPVFYYRRVRKMSNAELGLLLFIILTVGHYAVIWSIYLEKQLDELLSRKKREKRKKTGNKGADDVKAGAQEKNERSSDKPQWHDILPFKLGIWLYFSVKSLPQLIQDVKQYYEDYKELKIKEKEAAQAQAEQEAIQKEKRPKVKKAKSEFPVYTAYSGDNAFVPSYDQGSTIEDIEEQINDWLEDKSRSQKKKALEWTEEDLSQLTRSMVKFPGGTPGRWEKIAHDLGRSVADVTSKVKQLKDCVASTSGTVRFSELKSTAQTTKGFKGGAAGLPDDILTKRDEEEEEIDNPAQDPVTRRDTGGNQTDVAGTETRHRKRKAAKAPEITVMIKDDSEEKQKGRRQRDFDSKVLDGDSSEEKKGKDGGEPAEEVWTQNQQKLLELALQQYPKGTAERWDKIAKCVPGKSKEESMMRYKLLAELVQKRKQATS